MPNRWLQVKGDPMVREFLFSQQRVQSMFDDNIDRGHDIVTALLAHKGVFHANIHYSSTQITTWFCDDVYRNRVYVREEMFEDGFLDQFRDQSLDHLRPLLDRDDVTRILEEFKRLRLTDETLYLRGASINVVNGMISMTFSCDGTHYIDHRTFFDKLDSFGTVATDGDARIRTPR